MRNKKINICEVSYNWPAEVFIQRHVNALGNHLPIVLVARHDSLAASQSASIQNPLTQIPALIMPNFDHLSRFQKAWSLTYLLKAKNSSKSNGSARDRVLLAFFEQLNPSLIHFHFGTLAVAMRWIAKALNIPFTVSLRGSDIQVHPLRSDGDRQELYQVLREASGIHTVCDKFKREIQQQVQEGVTPETIYTTVPFPEELPPYQPSEEAELNLLAIGRLHWRKDFLSLLKALRLLRNQGVDARLSLVGSGPDEDQLRYWISHLELQPYVQMIGKADFGRITDLFALSHAYVQSSIAEGLSNSLAEAMAWGCPVFATEVGGTSEIVNDGENGFLFHPGEPELWVKKLALALNRPLMEKLRQKARETAQEFFSPKTHQRNFIEFYERSGQRFLENK
jgi:glycosyltransferase involved in cell wall biosynthesis